LVTNQSPRRAGPSPETTRLTNRAARQFTLKERY
jgi:hypothetical protein